MNVDLSRFDYLSKPGVALVAAAGIGDLLTTYVGITYFGATESNPIPALLFAEFGYLAFVALKAVAFAFYLWVPSIMSDPDRGYRIATLTAATPWTLACIINLTVIASIVAGNGA